MLIHLEGYLRQSVISELLLLIGTRCISNSSLALGVLAGVDSRHLLRHTVLLMVSCTFQSILSKFVYVQVFSVYKLG
jgi:hypothetical protein